MRLGEKVRCTGYIKRSGDHYETLKGSETENGAPACFYWKAGADEGVEVEDFHVCDRFIIQPASFTGVYVGTTEICMKLNAEWCEGPYTPPFFRTFCDKPRKLGVVYYADNKKRLVPLEMMEIAETGEMEQLKAVRETWEHMTLCLKRGESSNRNGYWTDGEEILCRTEEEADHLADFLEDLGFDCVNTGYYDPEEDKRSGEVDRHTGFWYVSPG